jgi:hypothetical protein
MITIDGLIIFIKLTNPFLWKEKDFEEEKQE